MNLYWIIVPYMLVWSLWSWRRTRRQAQDFQERFGRPPGRKSMAIPIWNAGFTVPDGLEPTAEMQSYLDDVDLRNWLRGGVNCIGLTVLIDIAVLAKSIVVRW